MKIKTITCHNVYNYGAVLQEYALLVYLKSLGHEVSTINYKPDYLSGHFNLWAINNPRFERNIFLKYLYLLVKLHGRLIDLKRKRAFDIFEKKYIPVDKQLYTSNEELKANLPDADAYICGSDQIWNTFFQNGSDPAFYLDFVPDHKRKISYAASFAVDDIDDELRSFVQEKISRLDFISVRETSGIRIIQNLGIERSLQVLDPVFLINKLHWKDNFVFPINEKYLFIYDFDKNPEIENLVKRIAGDNGLKIYTVNRNVKYADKNFWSKGPEYFLSLIANAQFIISNSFHAVAFSLIFNKEFIVFNRQENINTRMRDLLQLLNISHLLIDGRIVSTFKFKSYSYEEINAFLNRNIQHSKEFLKKALAI